MISSDNLIEIYWDARVANYKCLNYLRKCRIQLLYFSLIDLFMKIANQTIMKEAKENTETYIQELKDDRYGLRVYGRAIRRIVKYKDVEFEDELAKLIECWRLKAESISEKETYYIEKISSQLAKKVYLNHEPKPEIEKYNNEIHSLMLKLSND